MALAVGYTTLQNNRVKSGEVVVNGKLVSIDKNRLEAGKGTPGSKVVNYPAVVEYQDQGGKTYQLNTIVPSAPMPAVGSDRKIAYDQANPTKAHEVSEAGNLISYLAFSIGILLLILGIVLASGIMQRK